MKLLLIVNPVSGGVDKEDFLSKAADICEKYGITFQIFKTSGENDKEKAQKAIDTFQPDKIAAVGGDGTVLFVASLLIDTDYHMGIIPMGSANGMATELFVNPDPEEALRDIIMSDISAGLDMIMVNDRHYLLHMGDVGINASIVSSYEKDENRGLTTYAKYFLEELTKLEPFSVQVKANGKTSRYKVLMAAICNARKYGTGVPLNTIGNPMDGKFEIVLVEKINAAALVSAGLSVFDEKFYDSQISEVIQTDEAELSFEKPRQLQLDGEVTGSFDHVKIRILKAAVKMITTRDNQHIT
jgi:diacylglycerol kinase (ATP)